MPRSVPRDDLRAAGDRDLADHLLKDPAIQKAVEAVEKEADKLGARRQLLGTAVRLSAPMAPALDAIVTGCRDRLGLETEIESYVFPDPRFNAAAVRPERGRLFVLFSSSLLEAFSAEELKFVVGHELGHHLFGHHGIPVGPMLSGAFPMDAGLALQLFAWQRYAEISCDRTGLVCAGALEPCARGLFKLASGLRGDAVAFDAEQFLAQVGDLEAEAGRLAAVDEPLRSDWFATHPFSPLRLRAAQLCAASELVREGGTPRLRLEDEVVELMKLMEPSYLTEKSDVAEVMRRLLFAGGVLVAHASGEAERSELEALEQLLGPGSVPRDVRVEAIRTDLPRRVSDVKAFVPALRRLQVIRDLCVIARADGRVDEAEWQVMREVAEAVGVDPSMVTCARDPHGERDRDRVRYQSPFHATPGPRQPAPASPGASEASRRAER